MTGKTFTETEGKSPAVKVLVVDDAPFMRTRTIKLLREHGFQVVEAGNGVEAVRKFKEEKPDAVMMDITLPEMDGLEALKQMKKVNPEARVCVVTSMSQASIFREAIKAGARDFVVKPFENDRFLAAVQKLLE